MFVTWPLWVVYVGNYIIITRGRTYEEALRHIMKEPKIPRGTTLSMAGVLPIDSAVKYSTTHPFNWKEIPPRWFSD